MVHLALSDSIVMFLHRRGSQTLEVSGVLTSISCGSRLVPTVWANISQLGEIAGPPPFCVQGGLTLGVKA